ncbi:hypothetical protein TREMEDRAFT_57167 [Tremella mesenterica DSM 1558]|uniref:uncharacterized protein n=1 Tax=Tremella mesenterica (strain ATCC 24925 / CBS 8224 / DSM 1558 / NBRC 9311 / NRRL Y-6157 / RJB 2259-6 / UBC 559-6) TaxID=578456 RepID=UPI0003F49D98|nr:uncharacterized protein TREMEDRAFT_57167 [Tremella mesenterica DSM 1558]EIW68631.1 hypothetical protein TREMEDRAFT_57167 [Tremella mesenterica DSM 1558]
MPTNTVPGTIYRPALSSDARAVSYLIGQVWSQFFSFSVSPHDLEHYLTHTLAISTITEEIKSERYRFLLAIIPSSLSCLSSSHNLPAEPSVVSTATIQPPKPPILASFDDDTTSSLRQKDDVSSVEELKVDDGILVGVAQLVLNASTPIRIESGEELMSNMVELQRLYVHHTQHGSGLSQTLFEKCEEVVRREGGNGMWLGVWEDNIRGKRFYEKMGMDQVGEKKFVLGNAMRRDLVMMKRI